MDPPKPPTKLLPTKPPSKQPQPTLLSTVLAEFDIQTQVNKMVVRTFDSLMRSNKQAFDFIKESEHKFTKFEERLSKAETYYQNIEANVNAKVELTENMSARLQEFAGEFWAAMKENSGEMIAVTKKFDQLSMEKKAVQNRVAECEKNIKRLQTLQVNANDKLNDQLSKVYQTITTTSLQTQQKLKQQHVHLLQLSQNIVKSRSLLQSKTTLLTTLLTDLQTYKHDRPDILHQLQKVFQQLNNRALKSEVTEMRGYVDSRVVEERERSDGLWMRVDTMVKVEERDRKREGRRLEEWVREGRGEVDLVMREMEEGFKQKIGQLSTRITQSTQQMTSSLQSLTSDLTALKTQQQHQFPSLTLKTKQLSLSLTQLTTLTTTTSSQLPQLHSNIASINETLQLIINENTQRKEELNSMRSNEKGHGDVEKQVLGLFERVEGVEKRVSEVGEEARVGVEKVGQRVERGWEEVQGIKKEVGDTMERMKQQLEKSDDKHTLRITTTQSTLNNLLTTNITSLQHEFTTLRSQTTSLINQKITSISTQLDSLHLIHQQITHFKQIFKHQLQENDRVNASVAEKMERVMGLFTKLKSDNTVRFEQLTGDLQRRAVEIKNSLGDLEEIKKYLSVSSECVTLLLAVGLVGGVGGGSTTSSSTNPKQPTLSSTLTLTQKQPPLSSSLLPTKPIKITSILQGWILQSDQTQQKVKYRNQNFSFSNRIKLIQLFLQYFVKQTEKIKGTILENGKDVFVRVLENGEEAFQQRKRVTSKRKPSELPKLHF